MTLRPGIDRAAYKILSRRYWSSKGWIIDGSVAPADRAYAIESGLMFWPRITTHDEAIEWILEARDRVTIRQVVDGFLASLSTRWLDIRAALGSLAVAQHFDRHGFEGPAPSCRTCGQFRGPTEHHLDAWNFARLKWGTSHALLLPSAAFDLDRFGETPYFKPTEADRTILRRVLSTAGSIGSAATPNDLERAIREAVPGNVQERRVLIEILGYCGVLQPRFQPSFLNVFVRYVDREEPKAWKVNWSYPASLWRGSDGVNAQAVEFWFPELESAQNDA